MAGAAPGQGTRRHADAGGIRYWNRPGGSLGGLGGPVIDDTLTGIGASSAGNVRAVGHYYNGTAEQTLALHCC